MCWCFGDPVQRQKREKTAVLWHMQSDVLITWIGMITTTPPIPERNKLKGLHWKSPLLFFSRNASFYCHTMLSDSVVFVHNPLSLLEISTCFMWHLLPWSRAASASQCHGHDKTLTETRQIRKDGEWVMCVFSLFADGGPFSMSCCTSLTMLHNEYVNTKMARKNPDGSLPSLLRFSIWCSKCCSALIIFCLKSDVNCFFNFLFVVDTGYQWH